MNLKFLVLRSIFENENVSQRKLAKDYFVSLGKINAVVNELNDDKLILKSENDSIYKITDKGMKELEAHKVDAAIIFACGMGVRLAPLTYDTPKSFIKIKGERMIERQIEQLIAAGITDITIMVGYMKEKFDYLIDKYAEGSHSSPVQENSHSSPVQENSHSSPVREGSQSSPLREARTAYTYRSRELCERQKGSQNSPVYHADIKLIYNREYKNKNTLSTFYHAREVMRNKNVYVCVSDVYISENIYHKYEVEPYYTGAFYEDCKDEWRYIVNSKNEIKAVAVGGKNDFCLVGPCFLTKEFLDEFIPMIEKYYNDSSTDHFYWEDVMVRNFENLPTIYLSKLDKGVIFEFDTINDLNRFDKETTGYGSEAIGFVSKAFNIKDSDIKDIKCVKEGMTNHSYKFTYDGIEYFARVPGEDTDTYIDRKVEGEILEKLKSANITEEVVYFDKNAGYKISKYLHGARPLNVNDENELKKCMALYKKFHLLDVKVDASCDIVDKVKEYLDIIKEKNIYVPYEDFDTVIANAKKIASYLDKVDTVKTITHGDPNPNNVLVVGNDLKMIDFEYGGMANPLSDIALFGDYVEFDIDKTFELYKMYKAADVGKDDLKILPKDDETARKMIIAFMALGGLYNAVWTIVRCAMGDVDFGEFGMAGYRAFKHCYKAFV